MPDKKAEARAKKDKREGKAPTTQAGEFVREEMHRLEEGKRVAKSRKQAVAIGLSKARRAGVDLPPPKKGDASEQTRKKAKRDIEKGAHAKSDDGEKTTSPSRKRERTKH